MIRPGCHGDRSSGFASAIQLLREHLNVSLTARIGVAGPKDVLPTLHMTRQIVGCPNAAMLPEKGPIRCQCLIGLPNRIDEPEGIFRMEFHLPPIFRISCWVFDALGLFCGDALLGTFAPRDLTRILPIEEFECVA